jgi:hypothetical protein
MMERGYEWKRKKRGRFFIGVTLAGEGSEARKPASMIGKAI